MSNLTTAASPGGTAPKSGSGFIHRSRSRKTNTRITPGADAAAVVSIDAIRACAWGERRNAAWSRPGSTTSSTKRPSPRRNRGSSRRFTAAPKNFAPMARPAGDYTPAWSSGAGAALTKPVSSGKTTRGLERSPHPLRRGTGREDRMRVRRVAHCAAMTATIGCSLLLALCAGARTVRAAEVKLMSTVALSATLDEVKPRFENATGHTVTIVYGVIAELKKRIQDGETADVMLLSRAALDDLQSQGKVAAGSIVNVASSSVSVAARAGASRPDISTSDALKRAVLASK